MKGIILAGGHGTRLHPITISTSKHLLPVYDKPMIYYPISSLLQLGVNEILLICSACDLHQYQKLLSDLGSFGIQISYATQSQPNGIAEALIIGKEFIGDSSVALILGDNLFFSFDLSEVRKRFDAKENSMVVLSQVENASRYGVVSFDSFGAISRIIEKPREPDSNWAVTGLYLYKPGISNYACGLTPSDRGELEITHVNELLREDKKLDHFVSNEGVWFDAGTYQSLLDASNYVAGLQRRSSCLLGSPHYVAIEKKLIERSACQFDSLETKSEYFKNLFKLLENRDGSTLV